MKELYWITRLDAFLNWTTGLKIVAWIILALVLLAVFFYFIFFLTGEIKEEKINSEKYKRFKRVLWACGIPSSLIVIITSLILIFVPSTKEACMIYLGGSVVDYVQGSEKIQEIPDKVVTLATDYLDTLVTKKEKKNVTEE